MASSGKGRRKQTDNSTAEKGQKDTIVNQYYLKGCSGVQIGNRNQQFGVFDDGVQLQEKPLEAETHGFTTYQVVVAMLNSILNPTHTADAPPVCLQKLEDAFNKLYGHVGRKRRFKEIAGLNLLSFLKLKPEKFDLTLKESNWFVQSVPLTLQGQQQSNVSENEGEKTIQQRSTKTLEPAASSVHSSDNTSEEETDDDWTVVERNKGKGSKAKRVPSEPKRKPGNKIAAQIKSYASILAGPPKQGSKRTERVSVKPTETKGYEMLVPSSPFVQSVDAQQVGHTQSAFESFLKVVDNFKRGHFVLMTGDLPGDALSKSAEVLTAIPWILVFDLDEHSRDQGLLGRVEEPLKNARSLHICSWKEHVKISEMATTWYFIRGYREIPETRFEKRYRDWFKQVNSYVTTLAEDISSFVQDTTVLKVVVIWNDNISKYLDYIVCKLDENIQQAIQIIICRDDSLSDVTQNDFTHMCDQVEENITVINISAPNLFHGIFHHIHKSASSKRNYDLLEIPTANDCGNTVDKQGFAWLHEHMDVIYMKIPEDSSSDVEVIEEEAHVFFKGGTLKWATRFLCGSEYLDVERDAMDQIVEKIKSLVLSFKSGLYTLHHAPGSGGSTLAQRVLWELRDISPCVQIHFHSGASVGGIVSRLEYLYERTHLPIIALIDGEDEHNVRYLRRSVRQMCLVVLHVKRYPYSMSDKPNTNKDFWLQGHVSKKEARNLATKFGNFCKDEQKVDALKSLSKDVKEGFEHQLYEFGLTAYLHEFNGIQSYVDGYLHLEKNTSNDLLPWQKMLGYISLVYYYGQTSIPCQFFARMLGKPANYVVSIDDFPFEVRQFVVIDASKGKSNEMRACHYIIAKEILEQLLTRGHASRSDRSESLSLKACNKLGRFAVSFIDDASLKKVKLAVSPQAVMHVLVQTFISRDSKDMDESETQSKKRPSLAKLLVDITSKPPYTERLQVLEKLSKAFPKEPNFHAHLGRFYAMCRPNEEDKAILAFETALNLCQKKMEGKNPEEQNERLKIILSHIYHMYGMIYGQKVNRFKTSSKSFDEMASDILQLAELACDRFVKCREAKPPGHEDSFGYVGEIKVRLQVCDFVRRHSGYENMEDYIAVEKDSENGSQIAIFIQKSITAIDDLIIECSTVVDPADIDSSFFNAVTWHQNLLGKYGQGLESLNLPDTIGSKRFKIAAKKLKHGGHAHFESIRCEADIKEIVASFQEIFEDAFYRGVEDKRTLEIDFQEWLHVIRHESLSEVYSLETVLSQVRQWHSMLSSPMSKFYLFVLTSIIGFGSEMGNGNPECLSEAKNLKEELRKYGRWVTRSRYPREWLGNNGRGIKCLISNKIYAGNSEGEVMKLSNARRSLCVCRGTIRPPNKNKVAGFIELDLGNNYVPVSVFFVPLRTKFEGPINSGVRVEFHLGFTFFNGYEAFNVKALKKYECILCGSKAEILSCEQSQTCVNERCQQQIFKSEEF